MMPKSLVAAVLKRQMALEGIWATFPRQVDRRSLGLMRQVSNTEGLW